jgi:hypothetical protein
MSASVPRWSAWLFGSAVFVSAFQLFQVQPLISKAILPWFGGTPGVWTTCMLFFQVVLFAGYAYAHLVSRRLPIPFQAGVHVALLAGALATLSILPESDWKPTGDESPLLLIVSLLGATVGLPYFLLSTTGPLLQRWYSLVFPERSPYRLYALSNTGSLLALLTYPFVLEPNLPISQQCGWWQWGFWLFAGLCIACLARLSMSVASGSASAPASGRKANQAPDPNSSRYALWFFLAMVPSAMLLATTNQVCQGVAAVPFLWVAPLSLYLMSFILCFDSERWRLRLFWSAMMAACVLAFGWLFIFEYTVSLAPQVVVHFGALFALCMVCHGELARLRPAARHLTAFYLVLAGGGAAGSLCVAVVAPLLFNDYWEFYLCLAAGCGVAIVTWWHARGMIGPKRRPNTLSLAAAMLLVAIVGVMFADRWQQNALAIDVDRNFYGVLRTERVRNGQLTVAVLRNGGIIHGVQYQSPEYEREPTSYYSRGSGVGVAAAVLADRPHPLRIGAVGLGIGTVAAYGRAGDVIRFYEINPADVRMAQDHFTYILHSGADIQMVLGDARLSLERESPQEFDLLILDAFVGDAVPTHLLTREAMELYLRHLKPDGIIAVHVSNMHIALHPVVAGLAAEFQLSDRAIDNPGGGKLGHPSSSWILLTRDAATFDDPRLAGHRSSASFRRVLWTDDYSNVFSLLR